MSLIAPTSQIDLHLSRFGYALNESNKFYAFGSAPAYICGTPKMHKFFSSDSFPKFRRIISSIATLSYNLACFLCDLVPP